ncbi:MAG: NAD-dependent deacylase [Proteobacteria bacterium]|nr:NAD-dependent deacylase [Pseudomonadota bacterium]
MRVFALTGAGVSAESGLSTFRDAGGAWTRLDFRDVATPEGFARDPERVHAFYNARRANLAKVEPNAAHRALGALQQELGVRGGRLYLCTQNVDELHERGGAAEVVHMHGELRRVRCQACGWADLWSGDLSTAITCPRCGRAGGLRPDVVWFGETPLFMEEIWEAVAGSDLFVAIGTSGAVYPAAGLVEVARRARVRTCEINLQPSDNAERFDERLYGPATEVVPAWVARLLA